jgi:4-hydroxy-tetrahydrodipicolinate synthase
MNPHPSLLPRPLRGVVPPLATPLSGRDELDIPGLERLIERILAGGIDALFLLGTTGEGPSHSYGLRGELIDRACRNVAGRVPILVGITDTSFEESLGVARKAAEAGAQAVVLAPPCYFTLSQDDLALYVERLVAEAPLPVFLYNMPAMTKVQFEPATVRRLMDNPKIEGIKDSSGDLDYFQKLLDMAPQRPGWSVLMGPEELMAEALRRGANGGVPGGANYHPRLFADLYRAGSRGDADETARLQSEVLKVARIYRAGGYGMAVIKGIKCALSILGVCEERMAEPWTPFGEAERQMIRTILEEAGLLANPGRA